MASETPVVHIITFTTDNAGAVASNLRGYVERELARSAPAGFLSAVVLEARDGNSAALVSYWENFEAIDEVTDMAPWEAAMDLCEAVSDARSETAYAITGAAARE